jgi:DNA polymerase-4
MSQEISNLCRDCYYLSDSAKPISRCPSCGSPRIISHKELKNLEIAHVDCDAFFASVEKRDNQLLIDKPVIIGGGVRGVVSTCCYIARQNGVRSAMPTARAKSLCPNAIFIKPNMDKYVKASKEIRSLMEELTPLVEPLSIDEAFLNLSGTEKTHKAIPAITVAKFANKVEKQVGVSISIGLSHNKFLAKMASDLDKPRGFSIIGKEETLEFLAQKPVSAIYGVGKKLTQTLNKDGFSTIGQLQNYPKEELIARYGEMGARLYFLSRGIDNRDIKKSAKIKSISNETTFLTDISEQEKLNKKLLSLCEQVSARLKAKNLSANTLTLKLRSADFKLRTRSKHLSLPTQLAHVMYEYANQLLSKEIDGTKFRLIGIGMSGLKQNKEDDPKDLFEPQIANKAAAERAIDKVRSRFGKSSLIRGKLFSNEDKKTNRRKQNESN